MHRTAASSFLSRSSLQFRVAGPDLDGEICRLLRENPMQGSISLSLEREPCFFRGSGVGGAEEKTVAATQDGMALCVGSCSVRQRFINGIPKRVGYLGGLRLDRSVQGRPDLLRRGYQFFSSLSWTNPPDCYFTAITADNLRAQKFLEANLPGMPRYIHLGDYVTQVVPLRDRPCSSRFSRWQIRTAAAGDIPALCALLRSFGQRRQFATCWSEQTLGSLQEWSFMLENVFLAFEHGKLVAAAGWWDQTAFKQTVVRGYSRSLSRIRPLLNLFYSMSGSPKLPPLGERLGEAYVFPAATLEGYENLLAELLSYCAGQAALGQRRYLIFGFGAEDPCLQAVRRFFRSREYRSRVYRVELTNQPSDLPHHDFISPEVCLL